MNSKRFIALFVCFALLVASMIFGSASDRTVDVGSAGGSAERIETIEELASVFDFLLNHSQDTSTAQLGSITLLNADENSDVPANSKHKSATVHLSTRQSSTSSSTNAKYTNGVKESSSSLNRELTLYIDEGSTYYEAYGTTSLSRTSLVDDKSYVYKTYSLFLKFDMCMLVTDNKLFCKINDLTYTDTNSSLQIKSENVGKWINFSDESMIKDIVDIDADNRQFLNGMNEMINYLIESERISAGDKSISLNKNDWQQIFDEVEADTDLDGYDIDFEMDLSSATKPYISSLSSSSSERTDQIPSYNGYNITYESVTIKNDFKNDNQMTLENIDNTEISFDSSKVKFTVHGINEFERLFNIQERNKDDEQ